MRPTATIVNVSIARVLRARIACSCSGGADVAHRLSRRDGVARTLSGSSLFAVALLLVVGACAGVSRSPAPSPDALTITEQLVADSVLKLSNGVVCGGQFAIPRASGEQDSRCMPCVPEPGVAATVALQHARELWALVGKAPYQRFDQGPFCVGRSYDQAYNASNFDPDIKLERALFQTLSALTAQRVAALRTIDDMVGAHLKQGDSAGAAKVVEQLGRAMQDRARRMYARPTPFFLQPPSVSLELNVRETSVHELELDVDRHQLIFSNLPSIPRHSQQLGESEAWFASRLFTRAADLTAANPASFARYTRLALTPIVLLEDWPSLDSAARAIIARNPGDSVAPVALALARYRLAHDKPWQYLDVMKLFDAAVRAMPTRDSTSYDDVAGVLSEDDDAWRDSFTGDVRKHLDRRTWVVLDPLWLTPVNELQLERRARVAEANLRYADLAAPGQSGSETGPGIVVVKRGPPTPRWVVPKVGMAKSLDELARKLPFARSWPGIGMSMQLPNDSTTWRMFYSEQPLLEEQVKLSVSDPALCSKADSSLVLVTCARAAPADFRSVPFYGKMDTVDVTAARFRVNDAFVDVYLGARLPYRSFPRRGSIATDKTDSIRVGVWIRNEVGVVAFHSATNIPLPRSDESAYATQWTVRLGHERTMHRVEALDARHSIAARGWQRVSSSDASNFQLKGFGISDILIADSISAPKQLRSWRDLRVKPNGAVIPVGGSLALAWEVYGLATGADGRTHWRVTMRREDGNAFTNTDTRGVIIGSPDALDKVIPTQPNASTISYERSEPASPVNVDYLRFPPIGVGTGRHVVVIAVTDLVSGKTVTQSAAFRIADGRERRVVNP